MFLGEEDSPFHRLPPEMIEEVLSFVDKDVKRNARLVCRRWSWILDHPNSGLICFNPKINSEDTVHTLLNTHLHIKNLQINVTKMMWPVMTYSRNKFPLIKEITVGGNNSNQTLMIILQYACINSNVLCLESPCFGHVCLDVLTRVLTQTKWNQLSVLKLRVELHGPHTQAHYPEFTDASTYLWKNHADGVVRLFQVVTIPNLRKVLLHVMSYQDNEISEVIIRIMSEFTSFIERHVNTLKGLNLALHLHQRKIQPNFSSLGPIFSAYRQEEIAKKLRIESLTVWTSHFDSLRFIIPPCLWGSDKLTKLSWFPTYLKSTTMFMVIPDSASLIRQMLRQNQTTLVKLAINFSLHDPDPLQIHWLESCISLKKLIIMNKFHEIANTEIRLPTVSALILYTDWPSFHENGSAWIVRTFTNLQTVEINRFTFYNNGLGQCNWIEDLMTLPKLKEIRFSSCNKSATEFQNLVSQFCLNKTRLRFSLPRRNIHIVDCVPFLIRLLPI